MSQKKIKHILYADDDLDDVELFTEAVCKISDMCVLPKADGRQLILSLNELPLPDVILLDLYMPYHDGRSCIKAIRNLERFDDVPIIVYSTVLVEQMVTQCKMLGADYFIAKPTNFPEILRLVYEISGGRYSDTTYHYKSGLMYNCA